MRIFSFLLLFVVTGCSALDSGEDDIIRLPVNVYTLSFEANPSLDSQFNDEEIRSLFDEVNNIWGAAGLQWQVTSISPLTINSKIFEATRSTQNRRAFRKKLETISIPSQTENEWSVFIFRQFPVRASGVYISSMQSVFYGELNIHSKKQPAILAHELGHSLGLTHLADKNNLMKTGKVNQANRLSFEITPEQRKLARKQALKGPVLNSPDYRPGKQ